MRSLTLSALAGIQEQCPAHETGVSELQNHSSSCTVPSNQPHPSPYSLRKHGHGVWWCTACGNLWAVEVEQASPPAESPHLLCGRVSHRHHQLAHEALVVRRAEEGGGGGTGGKRKRSHRNTGSLGRPKGWERTLSLFPSLSPSSLLAASRCTDSPAFLPAYLNTFIPSYLRTYLPSYLHTYPHAHPFTFLPSYLHT